MTTGNIHSFSSKWSPALKASGFTEIPNALIKNQANLGITDSEMVVVVALASFKWDHRLPYPSVTALASLTGKSDSAVRNSIRNLENRGIIKRVYRDGETNMYDLKPLVRKLESYAQPTRKKKARYEKINTPPYQKTNTKEYPLNNTKLKRSSNSSGKPTPIKELLIKRYPP
jgi:DNA-binding transcriptional ArsR family regulator